MRRLRKEYTLKIRLMKLLLSCLQWGAHVKWSENQESAIQKKLKVQHPFDAKRIRSCIDLIEDTEEAIISFSKYGIEKYSSRFNSDFGGKYLRLYGILNAVQQQKLAIIELYEVLKISNKTQIKRSLDNLKIIEIRNVVGAHTINLNDIGSHKSNEIKTNFFRITQMMLTNKADNIDAVDGFNNIRNYNLYESCLEYNRVSEKILYDGIMEYTDKIFKNANSRKIELLNHYSLKFFNHHNYAAFYENEKLSKRHFKRISDELEKEMTAEYGSDWRNIIEKKLNNMTENELLEMERIQLDWIKNNVP